MSAPPEAVQRASGFGHTVQVDPPAAVTAVERWTCTGCGRAVLDFGGLIYGSAVDGSYCDRGQDGAM